MWLVPLLFGLSVCGEAVAEACSCGPRSATCGPSEDFWRVSAVFVGRVTAIDRTGSAPASKRRVRMLVIEKFRGDIAGAGGQAVVFTDAAALCGYPFRVGKEYVVYAMRQDEGRLMTSICLRTSLLDRSQVDLAYARNAVKGSPPPGRIVGQVRQANDVRRRAKLLSGIMVVIARNGLSTAASTDAWGRYTIEPPSVGTYILDVQLPDTQFTPQIGQHIEFSNPHACAEVNIDVLYDGRVTGRITDSMGRGVAGLTVSYSGATQNGMRGDTRRVLTRDDGTYSLQRLPPGAFAIRVELPSENLESDAGDGPEETVQEPPSLNGVLGPGHRLNLAPLALPSSYRIVRLEGIVHDAAGVPATGARVFLKGGAERSRILGEPAVTDSLGRFVITVVEGMRYDVFAERVLADRRGAEFSDAAPFTALPVMSPVRLTLRLRF